MADSGKSDGAGSAMPAAGKSAGGGAGAGAGAGAGGGATDATTPMARMAQVLDAVQNRVSAVTKRGAGVADAGEADKHEVCESYVRAAKQKCECVCVCAWVGALGHGDATDATLPIPSAPMVKYMLDAMKQKGCKLPHDFIQCISCGKDSKVAGAFAFNDKGNEKVVFFRVPADVRGAHGLQVGVCRCTFARSLAQTISRAARLCTS